MSDQTVSSIIKKRVPRNKILARIRLLEDLFNKLRDNSGIPEFKYCEIDRVLLLAVVRSYFYDIERLKLFHGINKANEAKIAAYTIKWICKLKPIYIDPKIRNTKPTLVINELFAIHVAFCFISTPRNLISDSIFDKLLYSLVYRNFDEGCMTILFDFFIETYLKQVEAIRIVESMNCCNCNE